MDGEQRANTLGFEIHEILCIMLKLKKEEPSLEATMATLSLAQACTWMNERKRKIDEQWNEE